jgi:surface carbohydrate biosynthesis protein (TIGR04326 family)
MAAAVRRLGKMGFPVERFIYVYENQPWERALCWQSRRSFPEASLVGYQHAAIPRFMLKFYLAENGESAAPLPDRIVTVGEHTAGLMRSGGYDESMVRVGGAINFPDETVQKAAKERNGTGATGLPNTVLFAASVGLEDAVDLTYKAMDLFGPGDGVDVVIKYHPAMPLSRVAPLIGRPMPTNVKISNDPILDLFKESAVLVYTESSVCFQALATGLPAVHLKPQFDLDMDPLDGASDARLEASNVEELREQVSWLLENREDYVNRNRDRWAELLGDMYGPVNEDSYLAFVD